MTSDKAIQFIDSLIQKTKSKKITWKRVEFGSFKPKEFIGEDTYICIHNGASIFIGDINPYQVEYDIFVSPPTLSFYSLASFIDKDNDKIRDAFFSKIERLFNIIYNSLPSIDAFIDEFIDS